MRWQGLVQMPNGVEGASLWLTGTAAPDFTLDQVATGRQVDSAQKDGHAGGSQSGFENEFLLADNYPLLMSGFLEQRSPAELGFNSNPALSTQDSHSSLACPPKPWRRLVIHQSVLTLHASRTTLHLFLLAKTV